MFCPDCGYDSYVVDSFRTPDEVMRCRKCKLCGSKFYTSESDSDKETWLKLYKKYRKPQKTDDKRLLD